MATPAQNPKRPILTSWKEIASYLGRGVRTVQRYERDLHLPVRRPHGKARSAVVALTEDLDAWIREAPTRELNGEPTRRNGLILLSIHKSIHEGSDLRERCMQLRADHTTAIEMLQTNVHELMRGVHADQPKKTNDSRAPR